MSSLTLNPATTALVTIDLQNGIVGIPLAPYTGPDVVSRSATLANFFRERRSSVIFVRVLHSELLALPRDAPIRDPNAPPPPASASELVAELDRQPEDIVVTKRQWGAFYGTDLEQQLRRRSIRTIVIGAAPRTLASSPQPGRHSIRV
jgi:nicotinamidase-related amidase